MNIRLFSFPSLFHRPAHQRQFQCVFQTQTQSSSPRQYSTNRSPPSNKNARWLSDIKGRIGKCVIFGMDKEQTKQAAAVCKILGEEWRDLVAGREGFLVDKKRAGLLRHKVVWGEMDSMVCSSLYKYVIAPGVVD